MHNIKRIVTGLLFTATLALSIIATGADAAAAVRGDGARNADAEMAPVAFTLPAPLAISPAPSLPLFYVLGVTWE